MHMFLLLFLLALGALALGFLVYLGQDPLRRVPLFALACLVGAAAFASLCALDAAGKSGGQPHYPRQPSGGSYARYVLVRSFGPGLLVAAVLAAPLFPIASALRNVKLRAAAPALALVGLATGLLLVCTLLLVSGGWADRNQAETCALGAILGLFAACLTRSLPLPRRLLSPHSIMTHDRFIANMLGGGLGAASATLSVMFLGHDIARSRGLALLAASLAAGVFVIILARRTAP